MLIHIHTNTHVHICTQTYIYIHTHTHVHMLRHIPRHTIHTHLHIYTGKYAHTHIHINTYTQHMHIHKHIYTHIHTSIYELRHVLQVYCQWSFMIDHLIHFYRDELVNLILFKVTCATPPFQIYTHDFSQRLCHIIVALAA